MRLWRLDRMVSIDLVDRVFSRREDFDLTSYAAQSFGVFQEEPLDVVLRFEPEAAEDAAGWVFHPSQSVERGADASLTVRFRAGGVQEMCWHLFTWGTAVTVVAPDALRATMAEVTLVAARQHAITRVEFMKQRSSPIGTRVSIQAKLETLGDCDVGCKPQSGKWCHCIISPRPRVAMRQRKIAQARLFCLLCLSC